MSEANDAFWGGRSGAFLDPENNFWEVAYNPNSVFDERGAMIEMNRGTFFTVSTYFPKFHNQAR